MRNNKQSGFIEMLLLILGLVAIVGIGAYYFLFAQKTSNSKTTPSAQLTSSNGSSTSETTADLDTELNAILLEDIDSDFKDIDSDLSSL